MPRLARSKPDGPGIRRVRAGRGFGYRDDNGTRTVDTETLERISSLVIPPAWTDVWISRHQAGHIQATGVDAAGRRQYIYHTAWRERKDKTKFVRALDLLRALPSARRAVTTDLRSAGISRRRVLGAAFRLLDAGSLRVGSERYAKTNGSFGLTTLLCSHATVTASAIDLKFPAKSHHAWESHIVDTDLAKIMRELVRRDPHAQLLAYREKSTWHPLSATDVNAYITECTGGTFTAKDFRTLHGTLVAATSLAQAGPQATQRGRARAVSQAMRDVAAELGNTPAVARRSYVDPRVLRAYQRGRTIDPKRLSSAESELLALLDRRPT